MPNEWSGQTLSGFRASIHVGLPASDGPAFAIGMTCDKFSTVQCVLPPDHSRRCGCENEAMPETQYPAERGTTIGTLSSQCSCLKSQPDHRSLG